MKVVATFLGLGSVLLVLVGLIGLYVSRQHTLSRRAASFACQLNAGAAVSRMWQPGIAEYGHDRLLWWQTLSLSPRPARVWSRYELAMDGRAPVGRDDEQGRPLLLVQCRHRGEPFQLILSAGACAGLVSWLESSPGRARGLA